MSSLVYRQTSSRSQRKDRTQYLLETGFPVVPLMPTPALVHPTTDEYFEDDGLYEDMEGKLIIWLVTFD